MAYLPTVNDLGTGERNGPRNADGINKSVLGRFSFSGKNASLAKNVTKSNSKLQTTSVDGNESSRDVLEKLYTFVVKDTSEKRIETIQSLCALMNLLCYTRSLWN